LTKHGLYNITNTEKYKFFVVITGKEGSTMPKGEYVRTRPPAGRKQFGRFSLRPKGVTREDKRIEDALASMPSSVPKHRNPSFRASKPKLK